MLYFLLPPLDYDKYWSGFYSNICYLSSYKTKYQKTSQHFWAGYPKLVLYSVHLLPTNTLVLGEKASLDLAIFSLKVFLRLAYFVPISYLTCHWSSHHLIVFLLNLPSIVFRLLFIHSTDIHLFTHLLNMLSTYYM